MFICMFICYSDQPNVPASGQSVLCGNLQYSSVLKAYLYSFGPDSCMQGSEVISGDFIELYEFVLLSFHHFLVP